MPEKVRLDCDKKDRPGDAQCANVRCAGKLVDKSFLLEQFALVTKNIVVAICSCAAEDIQRRV